MEKNKRVIDRTLVDWIAGAGLLVTFAGFIVALIGLYFVHGQLKQSNEHKRWDNYNSMNNIYRQMYVRLQGNDFENLRKNCLNFDLLQDVEKAWITSYYNLYSEEYDLHTANLLPENMMDKVIRNGFILNLKTYPSISEGFYALKSADAFKDDASFVTEVETRINEARGTGFPSCDIDADKNLEEEQSTILKTLK